VKVLKRHYGAPAPLPTSDPFELVLWENIAYLATPARRRQAFAQLKATVGTSPARILSAKLQALELATAHGILKGTFAAKLQECAQIVMAEFGGDLAAALRAAPAQAKRILQSFPGVGEPGAEKILLFAGHQSELAPESNGLRVLVRLGLVVEERSYSRTYTASRQVASHFSANPTVVAEAHLLLQQHGQTLCKRGAPRCGECPLERRCAHGLGGTHSMASET
jgi:endonuclease III